MIKILMRISLIIIINFTICEFGAGDDSRFQSQVEIENRGFTIYPPVGWSIKKNFNGASLFFQAPLDNNDKYRRNIRIMTFKGAKYIDEVSLEEFSKEIEEKSSKMSNAVQNYRIRDLSLVELGKNVPAGLFYADFKLNGLPMMQMRLLISTADFHFLMTFTDVQENFEDTSNGYLDQAYQTFQTVELDSHPPGRNDFLVRIGVAGVTLIILITGFSFYRKYRVKKLGAGIDEFDDDDDENLDDIEEADGIDDVDDMDVSHDKVLISEDDHEISKPAKSIASKKKGLFSRKKKTYEEDEEDDHNFLDLEGSDDKEDKENKDHNDDWKLTM